MYSIDDILKNVKIEKNLLSNEEMTYILEIIKNSKIKNQDIFSKHFHYNINLLDNNYITENIYTVIKNKFNYNGILENVYCKIMSYDDNEEYNRIKEDKYYTIFSLDLVKPNLIISSDDIIDIVFSSWYKDTVCVNMDGVTREYIVNILGKECYKDTLLFSEIDLSKLSKTDKKIVEYYNLVMQNLNDFHGHLNFMPNDKEFFGVSYEHINNNCIKFPGDFIQKKHPHHRSLDQRTISIIFICKNI